MARGTAGRAGVMSALGAGVLNARSYGFLPTETAAHNDDAIAEVILDAIRLKTPIVIPGDRSAYPISAPINAIGTGVCILGAGKDNTKIVQQESDVAILQVGGEGCEFSGMTLYYETAQTSAETDANAIEPFNLYFSRLADLQINYSARAIFTPSEGASNAFFSNHVDGVFVYGMSISALWLLGYNIGNTGSVFDNIHIGYSNVTPGVSGTATGQLVYLESMSGSVFNQLNVEHTKVSTNYPVQFRDCNQLIVNGLYFEGIEPMVDAGALVAINGPTSGSVVTINGFQCHSGQFLSANGVSNSYAMVNIDDASEIAVNGFSASGNTKTSPFVTFFNGAHASTKTARLRGPYDVGSFIEDVEFFTGADPQFPIVKEFNGTHYYRKDGTVDVLPGTAAPVAGTWGVGDQIINTAPASAGNIGWVCTTAGTPGTWKTFGTIA